MLSEPIGNVFKYLKAGRGLDILKTMELYLSAPNAFNDPFEFSPKIDASGYTKERVKKGINNEDMFEEYYKRKKHTARFRSMRKPQCRKWYFNHLDKVAKELHPLVPSNAAELTSIFAKKSSELWAVGCFSKTRESILMWSHYSKEHTGIVLEFDLKKPPFNDAERVAILPVEYEKRERVTYNAPDNNKDFEDELHLIAKSKFPDWGYEKEVRIIVPKGSVRLGHLLKLSHESIVSVTFGCKYPPQDRDAVLILLRTPEFAHVKVYQANTNPDAYVLDFVELSKS